jgi:hypothetical protein
LRPLDDFLAFPELLLSHSVHFLRADCFLYHDHSQLPGENSSTKLILLRTSNLKASSFFFHFFSFLFLVLREHLRILPVSPRSHTHPSHCQPSCLLTSSLSLGVSVPEQPRVCETCRSLSFNFIINF